MCMIDAVGSTVIYFKHFEDHNCNLADTWSFQMSYIYKANHGITVSGAQNRHVVFFQSDRFLHGLVKSNEK